MINLGHAFGSTLIGNIFIDKNFQNFLAANQISSIPNSIQTDKNSRSLSKSI